MPQNRPSSTEKIHQAANQHGSEDQNPSNPVSFTELAPLPVILSVVDDYFHCCHNQPYSFFHEESFRHRLSNGFLPDHLLLAVLASAVRFSSHPFFNGKTHEVAVSYADKSWKSIVSSCFAREEGTDIMTVQTITLLSIFDFTGMFFLRVLVPAKNLLIYLTLTAAGHERHGSAWVKIGLSVRIAQDLRLMMNGRPDLPIVDQEERRRVFWSLYLLDRIVSCGRARPPAILEASCQLQLPCDESAWRQGQLQTTDTLDQLSNKTLLNANLGPFALEVIMAYVMSRCAQYVLQQYNIRSRYPPWDPNSDFASICSDLLYIESHFEMGKPITDIISPGSNLDSSLDHQTSSMAIFSRALFYLCHCLLNHPFLLRYRLEISNTRAPSSFLERSFTFGKTCAKRLAQLMSDSLSMGLPLNASFYGYCAVVSGSFQALYLQSPDDAVCLESAECVQWSLATLREVGKHWVNVSIMVRNLPPFWLRKFHIANIQA